MSLHVPTPLNTSNLVESHPGEDLILLVALLSAKINNDLMFFSVVL